MKWKRERVNTDKYVDTIMSLKCRNKAESKLKVKCMFRLKSFKKKNLICRQCDRKRRIHFPDDPQNGLEPPADYFSGKNKNFVWVGSGTRAGPLVLISHSCRRRISENFDYRHSNSRQNGLKVCELNSTSVRRRWHFRPAFIRLF